MKKISLFLLAVVFLPAFSLPEVYSVKPIAESGWVESYSNEQGSGRELAILKNSMDNINQMDFPGQIQRMEEKMQALQGKVDELQHQVDVLGAQQRQQFVDLDARLLQKSKEPVRAKTQMVAVEGVVPSDKQTYQAAYHLITDKKYVAAIEAFHRYLATYHEQGRYSANAYYWLGELYDLQKDYAQATQNLEKVVSTFPDSSKVADALYKLGMLAKAQGDEAGALSYFQQVVQDHPKSASAKLAKIHL
jgi:tol-pal system protein YbgF